LRDQGRSDGGGKHWARHQFPLQHHAFHQCLGFGVFLGGDFLLGGHLKHFTQFTVDFHRGGVGFFGPPTAARQYTAGTKKPLVRFCALVLFGVPMVNGGKPCHNVFQLKYIRRDSDENRHYQR